VANRMYPFQAQVLKSILRFQEILTKARSYFIVSFVRLLTPEIIYNLISHSVYAVNSRKMNIYFCQQWQLTLPLCLPSEPSFFQLLLLPSHFITRF